VEPPLESLMRQYPTMDNIFALQFRAKGGWLWVGSIGDAHSFRSPVAWTPDLGAASGTHYLIGITRITVGLHSVQISSRGGPLKAMLDSGTSVIAASSPLYTAIAAAFHTGNCTTPGICEHARKTGHDLLHYCFSRDSFREDSYPALSLTLSHGATLTLHPRQYMVERVDEDGLVMMCSVLRETKGSQFSLVLGTPFLRAFYTIFERGRGRIGFAEHRKGNSGQLHIDPNWRNQTTPYLALHASWENAAGLWLGLGLSGVLITGSAFVLCLYRHP
jgi:hypothetical protein